MGYRGDLGAMGCRGMFRPVCWEVGSQRVRLDHLDSVVVKTRVIFGIKWHIRQGLGQGYKSLNNQRDQLVSVNIF